MPIVDINGASIEFPDDLSPDQLNQAVAAAARQMQPQRGMIGKAWDALAVPEQMSRKGLGMLAEMVPNPEPTGNLALDFARGTPRVAAETLAEFAPSFISRGSILTAGGAKTVQALKPLIKVGGRQIAKGAEAVSGLEYKAPGVLVEAAKDAKLITAPGTKAAGQKFAEVMDRTKVRPSIARSTDPHKTIAEGLKALDDGTITPEEGLVARQALDSIKKSVPKFSFKEMRSMFDSVAKKISTEADVAFSRGVKADQLRNLLPQNKLGGTSIAKTTIGSLGGLLPFMSPAAQGLAATGIGVASRFAAPLVNNPVISTGLAALPYGVASAVRGWRKNAR